MRRAALLLAAPVLAAGLLSGCDYPGGTPANVSYDRADNNLPDEAAIVSPPATINP